VRRALWLVSLISCAVLASTPQIARAQVEAEFKDEFDKGGAAKPAEAPPAASPSTTAETPAPTTTTAQPSVETAAGTATPPTATAAATVATKPAADNETPFAERGPSAAKPAKPAAPESRDAQLLRVENTWLGPAGGLHVVDAGSGPPGTLRLQLGIDFFATSNFLLANDKNQYSGGTLALSWTVADYLEIFGSLANHANFNNQEVPQLLQVLGDTLLGIKAFQSVEPWLTLGGDFRIGVLNTVGNIGPVLSALSFGFRGNLSADLRQIEEPVPFIGRFTLDYYFDNSSNLIEKLENQRYEALGPDRRPRLTEDRNLLRRVERFALGINRTDALNFSLGVEAPLQVDDDFYIHPLLEWTLGVPVNRQGYSCLRVQTNATRSQPDGCLKLAGLAGMPSTFTLGARVFPPVRGLAFTLGLDIGLSGTSIFVRELAANKPYDVLIALSYTIDTREKPSGVREVEVVREVVKPLAPNPRVDGLVIDAGSGAPVANATIRYPDSELTAQQADDHGHFMSYERAPGEARFEISHPDYEGRLCTVEIPVPAKPAPKPSADTTGGPALGKRPAPPVVNPYLGSQAPGAAKSETPVAPPAVPMRCELTAKPRAGSMRGIVMSEAGKPVAGARVDLTGPSSQGLVSDAQGQFVAVTTLAGSYGVRVDADGYLIRLVSVEVKPGETATPEITLVPKPKQAQVELTKQEVRIRKQIFFRLNSAEISEKSNTLLSEIADVLLRNPQVKLVEIQGHTDNKGAPEVNQQLSQLRADAVRAWLVNAGVDQARLTSKGYGDTRPIEPNLTERHRARNRRVQFMIKTQE
jgi:outer membrane protein OmpA-like peptidoglycan-associated protein